MEKQYVSIDLKSFYASVECVTRNLDPLNTNLVVADNSRTEKTICLAVSPSLKTFGIPGRPRLFEVIQQINNLNNQRKKEIYPQNFKGKSHIYSQLIQDKTLKIDYIVAKPRMAYYLDYSNKIYQIYLKYIAKEDIHVYSIDEVFIDLTNYQKTYNKTAYEITKTIIKEIERQTGITATAGIGTNLYLCKIAMDILAKKTKPDKDNLRIATLNETTYKEQLWDHKPITDFWRIGKGYKTRLQSLGLYTMGDIALYSQENQENLYKIFGKNAELLIDHAYGIEPVTIKDIKAYKPQERSIGKGQVLQEPYTNKQARLVTWEMADQLTLQIVDKNYKTNQITLTVNYDTENLKNPQIRKYYQGEITIDPYGRQIPKSAHGTINLENYSSSTKIITKATTTLYDKITNPHLLIRKINISFNKLKKEDQIPEKKYQQLSIFENYQETIEKEKQIEKNQKKERALQESIIYLQKKYGKNAILKGSNLQKDSTAKERNNQIGGHKA